MPGHASDRSLLLQVFVPRSAGTLMHPYLSVVLGIVAAVVLCLLLLVIKRLLERCGFLTWRHPTTAEWGEEERAQASQRHVQLALSNCFCWQLSMLHNNTLVHSSMHVAVAGRLSAQSSGTPSRRSCGGIQLLSYICLCWSRLSGQAAPQPDSSTSTRHSRQGC